MGTRLSDRFHFIPDTSPLHSGILGIAPPRLGVIRYLWVLTFIITISRQYLYRFVLAPEVAKWAPLPF